MIVIKWTEKFAKKGYSANSAIQLWFPEVCGADGWNHCEFWMI